MKNLRSTPRGAIFLRDAKGAPLLQTDEPTLTMAEQRTLIQIGLGTKRYREFAAGSSTYGTFRLLRSLEKKGRIASEKTKKGFVSQGTIRVVKPLRWREITAECACAPSAGKAGSPCDDASAPPASPPGSCSIAPE